MDTWFDTTLADLAGQRQVPAHIEPSQDDEVVTFAERQEWAVFTLPGE